MDLGQWRYYYNKYWVFLLYDWWWWIGKTFTTYELTYFERYEKIEEVKQQLEYSFQKVCDKYGYGSIEDMFEKVKKNKNEVQ